MGANGSYARGDADTEAGRAYECVGAIGDNIKILEQKDKKKGAKLPEESHTPNRIYAVFRKDGKDVKAIAQYDENGKKVFEIHTQDHHGLGPHYHKWKDGKPESGEPHRLTKSMQKLLDKVRNFKK